MSLSLKFWSWRTTRLRFDGYQKFFVNTDDVRIIRRIKRDMKSVAVAG